MPDVKFSQLNQLQVAAANDYLPVIDTSDNTMGINGTNKKISIEDLATGIIGSLPNASINSQLVGDIDAGKITSGTLGVARIPALSADKITSGVIDAARLPSYVDDVLEFDNLAAFPATGETSKIYVTLDTNKTYRWSGSVYIQINADETITLTGAVTGSGIGSFATTLSDDVVTLAKMANVSTSTVFYRKTAGTGDPEVQSLATLKTDLGLTGTNSGDQTITLTSDVTGSGTGSFATTISAGAVSLAKMANVATATVFYRKTAGTGDPEVQTLSTLKTDLGLTGTNSGDQTITLTGAVTGSGTGSFATTLSDDVVTLAKMANVATATVFYRKTAGTGDPEVQTLSTLKTDLNLIEKLTPSEYTVTNPPAVPLKTFNASTATIDDVYNVLATLIQTLKDRQII